MACLNLIDIQSGRVYFCYTPEPVIYDNSHRQVAGETHLQIAGPGSGFEAGCETHEVTKLLVDTVLYNAYLFCDNGHCKGLNIECVEEGDCVSVRPLSKLLSSLFINNSCLGYSLNLDAWAGKTVIWHGLPDQD